ncbi:MAG TPA: hypothetical protein VHE35_08515 [Kofleriaceae bacterium]|nr:hypothetical protein [Kofleriaceae bacterium]
MHPRSLVTLALLAVAVPAVPAVPAEAGPVEGKVVLPPAGVPRPPPRSRGFLDPIENPHLPVRAPDPFPQMAVVLEGATPAPPATPAPQVTWDLLGDSFARPLLAVRVGTDVRIRNLGRGTPILTAVGQPDLIAKKPLNPTGEITFNVGTQPRLIELADETTPYLRGRILVTTAAQIATPDATGKFAFADVPPGAWTVRVFYATGWVDRPDDKLTVTAAKATVNPALPPGLPVKAP